MYGSRYDIIVIAPAASGASLAPSFVPCDGREVGGEVVAVVQAVGSVHARVQQAGASVDCYHSSLEYSGLVLFGGRYVLPDQSSDDPVDWNLTINVRTAWVVPAPLLRIAGRTWVACIAAPLSGAGFRGRLAGAYSGGAQSSTLRQPLHVICDLEPVTQPLTGTLVGLRDRPIPYSR